MIQQQTRRNLSSSLSLLLFQLLSLVLSLHHPRVVVKSLDDVAVRWDAPEAAVAAVAAAVGATTDNNSNNNHKKHSCLQYGCSFIPRDVFYDEEASHALKILRERQQFQHDSQKQQQHQEDDVLSNNNNNNKNNNQFLSKSYSSAALAFQHEEQEQEEEELSSSGDWDKTTMTLIGYKGGLLESQVNQDRSILVSPFLLSQNLLKKQKEKQLQHSEMTDIMVEEECNEEEEEDYHATKKDGCVIVGVLDGHGGSGEIVSEYARKELPKLLQEKLCKVEQQDLENETVVKKLIIETFIEVDRTTPGAGDGGCTVSVALQLGKKLYVANAGDSVTFVAVHIASNDSVKVLYTTREDKPHLPDERRRIESMGGFVSVDTEMDTSSRVVYVKDGQRVGLAMSRSVGDHDAPGVTAEPIIEVIDIPQILLSNSCIANGDESSDFCPGNNNDDGNDSDGSAMANSNDKNLFVVSATDGMMDYLTPTDIARSIATAFYAPPGRREHPHIVSERLIYLAARGWQDEMGGAYRDDITIAATKIIWDKK